LSRFADGTQPSACFQHKHQNHHDRAARTTKGETDAGNGSNGICRVIGASRPPSPDQSHSQENILRLLCLLSVLLCCSCEENRDAVVKGYPKDITPMNEACKKAHDTVQQFAKELRSGKAFQLRYLAKVRVQADGETEYVWLEPLELDGDLISGPVINTFVGIVSVRTGDQQHALLDEISDWAVPDQNDKVLRGGCTLDILERFEGEKP
jgi:uncharacterized protein YegJ (DUF2314 family)